MGRRKVKKATRQSAFLNQPKPRYIRNKKLDELLGRESIKEQIMGTERAKPPKKVTRRPQRQMLLQLQNIEQPSCRAKKANARHNYFSMRKSGKGGSRTNPKTDRFNSKC